MFNFLNRFNRSDATKSITTNPTRRSNGGVQLIDPAAIKTDLYSRQALDFINSASNNLSVPYTEQQLLGAYLTSVYMFSALRRVSNLISRVKIVAEVKDGDSWERAPETIKINQIFANEGAEVLGKMWLNYAVYGGTLVFKTKTRRAIMEAESDNYIYDYKDGAVAGLHVIDKPQWDLDEDVIYGRVNGAYVNQYNLPDVGIHGKNYLDRKEFVYVTDWNPENPNRGKSIVAVAIHESVSNAAIAQWMSEYFTRGAMPFIMVSMEDDPAMLTDNDMLKLKRQFEEYWQGLGSSLRSVFFDRKVAVEQVGINASDVAAPDLNETALEGIAAAVGLDRELVVTPSGGSQDRHEALVMRAWNDTIIPIAEKFLVAFNKDLGLPPNMRLVLDLEGISELEADRQDKSDTELGIYDAGLQDYNETRNRLKMKPVDQLEGWYNYDGKPVPLKKIIEAGELPHQAIVEFATGLWDSNLAKRSEVLKLLNRELPNNVPDGYKYEIEETFDRITGLWGEDLLTRKQVLAALGYKLPSNAQDGYRSELERGADYGEFITGLWSDNLLTRSQAISLLDMGIELPGDAPDGYADEIGDRKQTIIDLWGEDLLPKRSAMQKLGITVEDDVIDGFKSDIDSDRDSNADREQQLIDNVMDYWGEDLLTKREVLSMLKLPVPENMTDGFQEDIANKRDADQNYNDFIRDLWGDNLLTKSEALQNMGYQLPSGKPDGYQDDIDAARDQEGDWRSFISDLWGDNLLQKSSVLRELGFELPEGDIDGYQQELDALLDAKAEKRSSELFGDNTNGEDSFRAIVKETLPVETPDDELPYSDWDDDDPDDDPDDNPPPAPTNPGGGNNTMPSYIDDAILDQDSDSDWKEILNQSFEDFDYQMEQEGNPDISDIAQDFLDDFLTPETMEVLERSVLDELVYGKIEDELDRGEYDTSEVDPHELLVQSYSDTLLGEPEVYTNAYFASDQTEEDLDEVLAENLITNYSMLTGKLPDDTIELDEDIYDQENPAYVSLDLSNNEDVLEVQNIVKRTLGEDDIDYVSPEEFHITLAYVPNIENKSLTGILAMLPKSLDALTLKVGPVTTFKNEDQTVVKIDVEQNDQIISLQQKMVVAFSSYGIEVSNLTDLSHYIPHITLAYAKPSVNVPDIREYAVVRPASVEITRDDYKVVTSIPLDDKKSWWIQTLSETEDNAKNVTPQEFMSLREQYETALSEIAMIRENWKNRVVAWANDPTNNTLPERISIAVEGREPNQQLVDGIISAIEYGEFDEEDSWEMGENPLDKYLENTNDDNRSFQDDQDSEINAWERSTLKNGVNKGLRFETKHIETDLAVKIKTALGDLSDNKDKDGIKEIFEAAKYAAKRSRFITKGNLDRWGTKVVKDYFDFDLEEDGNDSENDEVDNE